MEFGLALDRMLGERARRRMYAHGEAMEAGHGEARCLTGRDTVDERRVTIAEKD